MATSAKTSGDQERARVKAIRNARSASNIIHDTLRAAKQKARLDGNKALRALVRAVYGGNEDAEVLRLRDVSCVWVEKPGDPDGTLVRIEEVLSDGGDVLLRGYDGGGAVDFPLHYVDPQTVRRVLGQIEMPTEKEERLEEAQAAA